jgi:hypothetical protein
MLCGRGARGLIVGRSLESLLLREEIFGSSVFVFRVSEVGTGNKSEREVNGPSRTTTL